MRILRLVPLMMSCAAVGIGRAAGPDSPYEIVHGWPVLPEGEILGSAAGADVDSHGNIMVFHRAGRVWSEPLPLDPVKKPTVALFDGRNGKMLEQWGAGLFAMPHGLTIDDRDNVWLTDVALQQVFKFTHDGKLLMVIGERGVAGQDGKHFNRPTDVAVLQTARFTSVTGIETRVSRSSHHKGSSCLNGGLPALGRVNSRHHNAIKVDQAGRVYVADRQNDRVQVFDANGRFLKEWKSPAMGRPYSLVLLGNGLAAVIDGGDQPEEGPDRSHVSVVDMRGHVVETFGRFGNYDGQFEMGHDIAADQTGNLYVVDITGRRVQKFSPRH